MKIWLLRTSELLPKKNVNQRLLRVGMLCDYLCAKGHDVTWFSGTFNHFLKKHEYEHDVVVNIKKNYRLNLIHTLGYKKNISIARILNHKITAMKLRKKMSKLEKPDIIYTSLPTIEFAEEAIKYGKKHNVPVVIDIRDLWPDIFNHNLKGCLKFFSKPYVLYLNKKVKYVVKNCYSLISISDQMLEWGLDKGKRKKTDKDQTFFLGYKSDDKELKIKNVKFDTNKFNICFFATINNQFNYQLIIKIAKKLERHNVQILICGIGPNLERFKELAKNVSNIKFLGWLNKDELTHVLSTSKLGLLPYKNTFDFQMSVSNKFAEYTSYGLPLLLTSSGYMKELIEKNKIGIASDDVDKIEKFVLNLIANPQKHKELSNNSKKIYDKMLDADKIYEKLVNYLENIEKEYKK